MWDQMKIDVLFFQVCDVVLDVFEDMLSFYICVLDLQVLCNLDIWLDGLEVVCGKGKIIVLFLIDGNLGIWFLVLVDVVLKDCLVMGCIFDYFELYGLIMCWVLDQDNCVQGCFIIDKGVVLVVKVCVIVVE